MDVHAAWTCAKNGQLGSRPANDARSLFALEQTVLFTPPTRLPRMTDAPAITRYQLAEVGALLAEPARAAML